MRNNGFDDNRIYIKQVFFAAISKWRMLVLFVLLGFSIGLINTAFRDIQITGSADGDWEQYSESMDYYNDYKRAYEQYLRDAKDVLETGIDDSIPEDSTKMEQLWFSTQNLYYLDLNRAKMAALVEPSISKKPTRRDYLLYGVIGGGFGVIIGELILMLVLIVEGRVLSTCEACERYGLSEIGVLSFGKKSYFLTCGMDGRYLEMDFSDQEELLKMKASLCTKGIDDILLIGDVDEESLQSIVDIITAGVGSRIQAIQSKTSTLKFYEKVAKGGNVILVERIMTSKYRQMEEVIRVLKEWNNEIIGVIGIYK